MNPFVRGFKIIQQIGLIPVLQVALYRFGLITGHYRRLTPPGGNSQNSPSIAWRKPVQALNTSTLAIFFRDHPDLLTACLKETEVILSGKCSIFGNRTVEIFRNDLDRTRHWTDYELGRVALPETDIKFIWEPARMAWVYSLARAKAAGSVPTLGKQSWLLLERFLAENPVNCGPNWMNGQEVALRIFALVFFHEAFQDEAGMPADWEQILAQAIIKHARRIIPTLVYARGQRNNHLLVEAAGLYTAGTFLPDHPEANRWKEIGWETFHQALDDQIDEDGTYAQYSTNYHRLMLQTALWVKALSLRANENFPQRSSLKLAAATQWLAGLTSPQTGRVPNYGNNDGAYILPLTGSAFHDYRPLVGAAQKFFVANMAENATNEMTLWFEWLAGKPADLPEHAETKITTHGYRKLDDGETTAILFAPQFTHRPGQADLLHVELWRMGKPLLLDAGTFHYNADPPWQNALAQTRVHNTLTIDAKDQMRRAGRFLWLDWPTARWRDVLSADSMDANHDGYRRYGVSHERSVQMHGQRHWRIVDQISPINYAKKPAVNVCLHWLLQLSHWDITPDGSLSVTDLMQIKPRESVDVDGRHVKPEYQVIQAGEMLTSSTGWSIPGDEIVNLGWFSPTYASKEPALSYRLLYRCKAPITIQTDFIVC